MKTLLPLLVALSVLAFPCFSISAPPVVIVDTQHVRSEGNEEPLVDAVANCLTGKRPFTLLELQTALDAWAAALTDAKSKADAIVTKAEAALADPADLSPLAEVVADAKLDKKTRRLAEIAEEKAKLDAEKAELEKTALAAAAAAVKAR